MIFNEAQKSCGIVVCLQKCAYLRGKSGGVKF